MSSDLVHAAAFLPARLGILRQGLQRPAEPSIRAGKLKLAMSIAASDCTGVGGVSVGLGVGPGVGIGVGIGVGPRSEVNNSE